MSQPKRIDIKEFREKGYLQELNRNFLHPLGLALEIITKEGKYKWDDYDHSHEYGITYLSDAKS